MTLVALLPHDVAAAVAALLEPEELTSLAQVCRATASSPVFSPPKRETVVLPPNDEDRARSLVTSLRSRDPTRLSRFVWTDIARPWHIDLLVECGVSDEVSSIRVRPEVDCSSAAVEEICVKLIALPNLTKLDLSDTAITDVSALAQLTQLRLLDLSRTQVAEAAPLASLIRLEDLVWRDTRVTDMSCIENMTELRRLEVTRGWGWGWGSRITFPPMYRLNKLESMVLGTISILNVEDFVSACSQLRHLTIDAVYTRYLDDGTEAIGLRSSTVFTGLLVPRLPRLETITNVSGVASAAALSQIPTLRRIGHSLCSNADSLVALQQLEEMRVYLPGRYPSLDCRFLLQFPKLKTVILDPDERFERELSAGTELTSCLDIVGELSQLESLQFLCSVDADTFGSQFQRFGNLRSLTISTSDRTDTLECLKPCRSLRSLKVEVASGETDVSALGSLAQLEELTFTMRNCTKRCQLQAYPFLANLMNLKSLFISAKMNDLSSLSTLKKLEKLTIISFTNAPMQNYDSLSRLQLLQHLDVRATTIVDLTPLGHLPLLRTLVVSESADCRVLTERDFPRLLRVLHPTHNCLGSSHAPVVDVRHNDVFDDDRFADY